MTAESELQHAYILNINAKPLIEVIYLNVNTAKPVTLSTGFSGTTEHSEHQNIKTRYISVCSITMPKVSNTKFDEINTTLIRRLEVLDISRTYTAN